MAGRFLRFGGKAPKISFAAKIAFTLLFLLLTFWIFMTVYGWISAQHALPFWKFFVIAPLLIIASTVFCYYGVRMLTFERPSLYPEIDSCWEKLEEWVDSEKLAFDEIPFYMVLGTNDFEYCTAFHDDQKNMQIKGIPKGENEWLHWYGNEDGVYLHLKQCSTASDLVSKMVTQSAESSKVGGADYGKTLQAPETFGATMNPEEFNDEDTWKSFSLHADDANFNQSITPDSVGGTLDPTDEDSVKVDVGPSVPDAENQALSDDLLDRLKYVCERFKKAAPTVVPVQGVLVAMPFDTFQNHHNYIQLSEATRNDLLEIQNELQLTLPVSVVFGGMERSHGFLKLQQLIGSKAAQSGRFGAGCRLGDVPKLSEANVELLAEKACFTFDSWIMNKYHDRSRLSKALENQDLYRLLHKIRANFKWRLTQYLNNILKDDYGQWNTELTLTGCYFCATGDSRNTRGFIPGVLQKLSEFGEICGWSPSASSRESLRSIGSNLLMAASFVVLIATAVVVYWQVAGSNEPKKSSKKTSMVVWDDVQPRLIEEELPTAPRIQRYIF